MQQINLDNILLITFDINNKLHNELIDEFKSNSKSDFISSIDNRLKLNKNLKSFPFDTGFVVATNDSKLLGYLFISSIRNDEIFLEYSILKDKRGMGYGSLLLNKVTDYLFSNYNIKNIALDIDVSNLASIKTAISAYYTEDEYLDNDRIIYRNYNINYVDKRRNKNIR